MIFNADRVTLNTNGIFPCKKKPLVVHAIQMWYADGFEVTTLEGKLRGKQGDYLMFGVDGEKYPCDKKIFEKTYERGRDK